MIYNIYYINFDKVYEIKMMLSNIVSISKEIENNARKDDENEVKARLGARFLNFFNADVSAGTKSIGSDSSKVLETFEIKMTKSIILSELIQKSNLVGSFDGIREGELIKIDEVGLSLENEAELRMVKLFSNGTFKGMVVPGANGLDLNNIFNSILKDYAYKIKGVMNDGNTEILIKIPLSFESEFESSYSVDDLFIGKVSLVGIYKGKTRISALRNSVQFFQEIGSFQNNFKGIDSEIHESQYDVEQRNANFPFLSSDDGKEYHYIDLLAITQDVNIYKTEDKAIR